jgi:hypothetical protein
MSLVFKASVSSARLLLLPVMSSWPRIDAYTHKGQNTMTIDLYKLDAFTRQYLETALWSSTATDKDDQGEEINIYLNDAYSIEDIAPDTLKRMVDDCKAFQQANQVSLGVAYLSDVYIQGERYNESNAGHDFWLTRCGHGAGFWDRGLGPIGDILADAARACGNVDLYIGDDNKIHA